MKRFILAVAMTAAAMLVVAGTASAATPTTGKVFAHLTGTSAAWPNYPAGLQGAATVADAVAADDGAFIQLPPNYTVTMAFPAGVYATPDGTTAPDLTIYTYDVPFPAWAGIKVFVKSNTNAWVQVGADPVPDFQGDVGLNLEGIGMVNQVQVIQDGYYIDPSAPLLGFDLNAVSTEHYVSMPTGCGTPPTMDAPWTFVEDHYITAEGTGAVTPVVTTALDNGKTYRLFATGLYSAGPAFGAGTEILADARYSWSPGQTIDVGDSVFGYLSYGPTLLDLLINGAAADWQGAVFNDDHTYTKDLIGGGSPTNLTLQISDIYAQNNLGGLCVSMFRYPFSFDGFFDPIKNEGFNKAQAGRAIPVKFSLGGDQGLDIFASGYPKVTQVPCGPDPLDSEPLIVGTDTAGGSTLQYDASTDTYTYVWKTDKAWAGLCMRIDVMLKGGTTPYSALVQFK